MEADIPNMVRGMTFASHAWSIRPITMHWIAGQSEQTAFQNVELFIFFMYSNVWYVQNNMFFILNCVNTLHYKKIHKIVFFLATPYDPLKKLHFFV